jgi:hypothetical protein
MRAGSDVPASAAVGVHGPAAGRRGHAELLTDQAPPAYGGSWFSNKVIRIYPRRILSWHLDAEQLHGERRVQGPGVGHEHDHRVHRLGGIEPGDPEEVQLDLLPPDGRVRVGALLAVGHLESEAR